MKAVLICPGERPGVAALSAAAPLANVPILGQALIMYWLEHLAAQGVREVRVLATDRPELVRRLVGGGERWGLRVEVIPEIRELTVEEAHAKYCHRIAGLQFLRGNGGRNGGERCGTDAGAGNVVLVDRFPGLPGLPLFDSYAGWVRALTSVMPLARTPGRVGLRQIQPGVWVGLRTRISPNARVLAPCWIGQNVQIGKDCTIGPMAVVEDRAWIEQGAVVSRSVIGPDTFVGSFTEIHHSIAWEGTLIDWQRSSSIPVLGDFVLCSLARRGAGAAPSSLLGRLGAVLALLTSWPLCLPSLYRSARRGLSPFQALVAVRPDGAGNANSPVIYHELREAGPWLRRWPQLWNIVRGDFAWVGNRPLHPGQAAQLTSEFDKLWLQAPIGLLSLADTQGCGDSISEEGRAHATFYAAQAGKSLDRAIVLRALRCVLSARLGQAPRRQSDQFMVPIEAKPCKTG
jgi:Bacterial sugar transferase